MRGGEEGLPSRRRVITDANPEGQEKKGGEWGSCTERRGVVNSMTGGVEGAEHAEAVTLTFLIHPANRFWSVGRPQLIPCCGSVPMNLTLLGNSQLQSCTLQSRRTNAGAAGGC